MPPIITVTCAIIERDKKILIARRAPGQKLSGKWEFPGGKVEEGETPEECLKRELLEEFDIKVEVGKFVTSSVYHYDHISIELLAFHTKYISGNFKLFDHDEITWAAPNQLFHYELAEADIPIAEELAEGNR